MHKAYAGKGSVFALGCKKVSFMGEWGLRGMLLKTSLKGSFIGVVDVNIPQRLIYWGCCKIPSKVHLWVCAVCVINLKVYKFMNPP